MILSKRNSFKAILTGLLATIVSLTTVFQASAAVSIKDYDTVSDYAKSSIEKLVANGVIVGDANGNFNPHQTITRAEMATMLVKALQVDMTSLPATATFKDVDVNHWGYKFVEASYKAGLFKGVSEDMFNPEKQLSREEMAAIFIRALGIKDAEIAGKQTLGLVSQLNDNNKISSWAKDSIEFALDSGLMKGTSGTTFGADQNAEREQAAVMVDRVLENKESILKFHQTYAGKTENTELYTALRNRAYSYIGDYNATMNFKAENQTINETTGLKMNINGYTSLRDFDVNVTTTAEVPGESPFTVKFRMLRAGNNNYIQYENSTNWLVADPDSNESNDLQISQLTQNEFLKSFSEQEVMKNGNVTINGTNAVKYTIKLNEDELRTLASKMMNLEALAGTDVTVEEVFNKGYEYKMEFYLNDKNQLIHEEVLFTGQLNIAETGENITFSSSVVCDYSNIGKQITVSAPQ